MIEIETPQGTTPLDASEIDGLLVPVRYQSELNALEKEGIAQARSWARKSWKIRQEILTVSGMRKLHEKMFQSVWEWAGAFRSTEKNIGISAYQIQVRLHQLC